MEKGIAYSVKAKKARKDFRERKRPGNACKKKGIREEDAKLETKNSIEPEKARKDFRERKRPGMLARRRAFEKKMPNWKLKTASNRRKPGRISGSESDQEFL